MSAVLALLLAISLLPGLTVGAANAASSGGFLDNSDSSVEYSSHWGEYTNEKHFGSSGHLSVADEPNPSVTVTWTGGRAQVLGSTEHNNQVHGLAQVTLDGQDMGTISYSTPERTYQNTIYDTGELAHGEHTLTIRALDQPGEHGDGIRISFDALVYGNCLAPNTASCDPVVFSGDDMSDADFFSAIDLDHPGLVSVKRAVRCVTLDGQPIATMRDGETLVIQTGTAGSYGCTQGMVKDAERAALRPHDIQPTAPTPGDSSVT